jgi:hypothetical protein
VSTSAESSKPKGKRPPAVLRQLLRPEETAYLKAYGSEQVQDMFMNEYKNQFESLLSNQAHITREYRASLIDWLFEVGTKLRIEDRSVIFQAVSLMDRYCDSQVGNMPQNDLQLTGVTALFIASKNLEVDPIDMRTVISVLCFNKYSKTQFLERETLIRQATQYENEAPTILDFIVVLIRMLKQQV